MKKYLFDNHENCELDFSLPALVVSAVEVIQSKSVAPGLYLFKVFRPIWDEEYRVYGTIVTVSDSNRADSCIDGGRGMRISIDFLWD
jgi:hypothetical protein